MNKVKGITFIELLIAVAIIGILASVAYPSYTDFVMRSNRTEAQSELLRIANLQEQYFIDQRTYTSDLTDLGLSDNPFINTDTGGNYNFSATIGDDGTSFTLTATTTGTFQNKDSTCTTFTINEVGQKGAESDDCWE